MSSLTQSFGWRKSPRPPLRKGEILTRQKLVGQNTSSAFRNTQVNQRRKNLCNYANDVEEDVEAIYGGTPGGGYGAVEIITAAHGCSGFMADEHMVVTAAHCFDDLGLRSSNPQPVSVKLNYADGGRNWRCMTSSGKDADGKCTDFQNVTVYRFVSTGNLRTRDLAAVFPYTVGGSWNRVSSDDAVVGLYSGDMSTGSTYTLWGRGYNKFTEEGNGVMRYMTDTVDTSYDTYVETIANGNRVCKGDSGGPYMVSTGNSYVFAILSSMDTKSPCAKNGSAVWGTRLNESRIENVINVWRTEKGYDKCVPFMGAYWFGN
jgi:hypothetical protein